MASPFEFSYVFTVIGKIWEAMPVTLLLTFAPLFIGFLFGVPLCGDPPLQCSFCSFVFKKCV